MYHPGTNNSFDASWVPNWRCSTTSCAAASCAPPTPAHFLYESSSAPGRYRPMTKNYDGFTMLKSSSRQKSQISRLQTLKVVPLPRHLKKLKILWGNSFSANISLANVLRRRPKSRRPRCPTRLRLRTRRRTRRGSASRGRRPLPTAMTSPKTRYEKQIKFTPT